MKKSTIMLGAGIIGLCLSHYGFAKSGQDISMFPKAQENQTQYVIELQPQQNEQNYKVEFFLAKEMQVDCNYHYLASELEEKDLQGWGYNYFELKTNNEVSGTLMACNEEANKGEVLSKGYLQDYNSRLPLVIYTPKGYSVKYRIWQTQQHYVDALQK